MATNNELKIAFANENYDTVTLVDPTPFGYIHIAAEVDSRHPFLPMSGAKRSLIDDCKQLSQSLTALPDVQNVSIFKALVIPPGQGAFLQQRPDVRVARFDLSILIETRSVETAEALRASELFQKLESRIESTASHTHVITASNVRRMGSVDHERNGVFLFNYFYADDVQQNLAVWQYTAGWFEQETELDNSTLLLPLKGETSDYTVVNHCRWDHLTDILPSILFKPTFRSYVLGNFEANKTAPIPILYRLV